MSVSENQRINRMRSVLRAPRAHDLCQCPLSSARHATSGGLAALMLDHRIGFERPTGFVPRRC
jgi:hypothetical protein